LKTFLRDRNFDGLVSDRRSSMQTSRC